MATYSQDFSKVDQLLVFDQIGHLIVTDEKPDGFNQSLGIRRPGDNNSSQVALALTLASAGVISFWRRVSSEVNYDKLTFLVDDVAKETISGEGTWGQVSFDVAAGTHTFKWVYSKDINGGAGKDQAFITGIQVTNVEDSSIENMYSQDYTDYIESFENDAVPDGWTGNWAVSSAWAYSGSKSLKSNTIVDNQSTAETYVFTPKAQGLFSIRAHTSCDSYDKLHISVNGLELFSIGGNPSDAYAVLPLFKDTEYTLTCNYVKDFNVSAGSDCAWIDEVTFPNLVDAIKPAVTRRRFAQII